MITIPGWLIGLLTFPGVICHEVAHRFFCDLAGVPIYDVCYFQPANAVGYVIHARTRNLKSALLISIGPLIINTVLCSLISFSAVIPIWFLKVPETSIASKILIWVSISIGINAFPSDTDMNSFTTEVKDTGTRGYILFLARCLGVLFWVANKLSILWFDAVYACVVAFLLPALALKLWVLID